MDDWFSPAPPRILAHRGFALAPGAGREPLLENSLAAFAAARDLGVRHLETDVHATRDGVAVLWHDPDLEGFDGTPDRLADLTWAELEARGRGDRAIAPVADALAAFPDARFNFDVKAQDAAAPLARAIREARAEHRSLVCSFSDRRLAAIRALLPECPSSASGGRLARALLAVERGREEAARRALGGVDALQIPPRRAGITLVSPARLAVWKRLVREVHVWTVDDPAEMLRLWRAGVDGIVTDRADLAVAALEELGAG